MTIRYVEATVVLDLIGPERLHAVVRDRLRLEVCYTYVLLMAGVIVGAAAAVQPVGEVFFGWAPSPPAGVFLPL